jgi:hypothetical protein
MDMVAPCLAYLWARRAFAAPAGLLDTWGSTAGVGVGAGVGAGAVTLRIEPGPTCTPPIVKVVWPPANPIDETVPLISGVPLLAATV